MRDRIRLSKDSSYGHKKETDVWNRYVQKSIYRTPRFVFGDLRHNSKLAHEAHTNVRGRDIVLTLNNVILLVLCHLLEKHRELNISHRFGVPMSTMSDIMTKWINHMDCIVSQRNY